MANRYFIADQGASIVWNNAVWNKIGTTLLQNPNSSMDIPGGDVGNISAYSGHNRVDAQGRTSYTGEEEAARYLYGTEVTGVPSLYQRTTLFASFPIDGVLRMWWSNGGSSYRVFVNGLQVITEGQYGSVDVKEWSAPLNVRVGDHVEIEQNMINPLTVNVQVIPFAYNNPG